jgi:hypothetical protein
LKLLFIGDIIGKPGREAVKRHLPGLRETMGIDFVIANAENLAHGFGMTLASIEEIRGFGIDLFTGGNHSWDKKEVTALFNTHPIIRPLNYPAGTPGKGVTVLEKNGEKLGVINLLGHFTMGMVDNPFHAGIDAVKNLHEEGITNILIDFHAEATSEKNALLHMLASQVSFIAGTHTHIGTDDLMIYEGTGYVTDVGLTGCMDGVIGMDSEAPIYRFKTGLKKNYDIPKKCRTLFQAVVITLEAGVCTDAFKLKAYDSSEPEISMRAFRMS